MRRLLEINDSSVGFELVNDVKFSSRTAARAILKKGDRIALLHVSKHHYYKLPGGGVEEGEAIEEGLQREVMEETGCTFTVLRKIGEILEHRSRSGIVQKSYCYLADVEEVGRPMFTKEEVEDGFMLVWVTIDKAIDLIKNSKPDTYDGKFIVVRDLRFLKEVKT